MLPLIAAERGLFLHLRDGRLFGGPAGGRPDVADGRRPDRSSRRPLGDAVRLARRRGRPRRPHAGKPSARLCGGLAAARRRHLGVALRSGLRDARPHLRRQRALPDHRADARGRLRLHGELARDLCAARAARLAGHIPRLCGRAGAGRGAAARLRAAARRAPTPRCGPPTVPRRRRRCAPRAAPSFMLLVAAFASYAFIPSGLSAHLLGDPAARRDRRRHGRHDRDAVRPVAGRRPAVRAHLRAQRPSAVDRALRRHADRISLRDAARCSASRRRPVSPSPSCSAPPTG